MITTYEQGEVAKEKFKDLFWRPFKDKFNAIIVAQDVVFKALENDEFDVIEGDCCIKVFVFDLNDVKDFPDKIDGVEIKYFLTSSTKTSDK